jgi:hypothetical protein
MYDTQMMETREEFRLPASSLEFLSQGSWAHRRSTQREIFDLSDDGQTSFFLTLNSSVRASSSEICFSSLRKQQATTKAVSRLSSRASKPVLACCIQGTISSKA